MAASCYRPERTWFDGTSRVLSFEFAAYAELVAGETLSGTPTIEEAGTSVLTIGAASISGTTVRALVTVPEGTAEGTALALRCTVGTSGGATLVGEGILNVC